MDVAMEEGLECTVDTIVLHIFEDVFNEEDDEVSIDNKHIFKF